MATTDAAAFRAYVEPRMETLRRTAFLLCGDWHTADDLVAAALVKVFRRWRRVEQAEHVDAYVRKMLLRCWLDERRRPWRRERPMATLPDRAGSDPSAEAGELTALLGTLPPRRRAVLVLRFFCDLSVAETAYQLGCSEGTVKSQTARGLDTLRTRYLAVRASNGED